jgi:hypothetical protein
VALSAPLDPLTGEASFGRVALLARHTAAAEGYAAQGQALAAPAAAAAAGAASESSSGGQPASWWAPGSYVLRAELQFQKGGDPTTEGPGCSLELSIDVFPEASEQTNGLIEEQRALVARRALLVGQVLDSE